MQELDSCLNEQDDLDNLDPEMGPVVLCPILILQEHLDQEYEVLCRIKIVPRILHIHLDARVTYLSRLKSEKKELSDATNNLTANDKHEHRVVMPSIFFDAKENDKWHDEANGVDREQPLDELGRVVKLAVDDLLDCLLLEEVLIVLLEAHQVRQEHVVDVVEFLGFAFDQAQVLGVTQGV